MKRMIDNVTKTIGNAILELFSREVSVLPLQLIRVTEKFDIVVRPPFRGGVVITGKN